MLYICWVIHNWQIAFAIVFSLFSLPFLIPVLIFAIIMIGKSGIKDPTW